MQSDGAFCSGNAANAWSQVQETQIEKENQIMTTIKFMKHDGWSLNDSQFLTILNACEKNDLYLIEISTETETETRYTYKTVTKK